jgi:hypothetical protein
MFSFVVRQLRWLAGLTQPDADGAADGAADATSCFSLQAQLEFDVQHSHLHLADSQVATKSKQNNAASEI